MYCGILTAEYVPCGVVRHSVWQLVTQNADLVFQVPQGNFQHLIDEIFVAVDFIKSSFKQFELKIEIHANRAIEAYQDQRGEPHPHADPCAQASVGPRKSILFFVTKAQSPSSDDTFQSPILPPTLADRGNMRRLSVTSLLSQFG
jgi:hypothetical protein